MAAHGFVPPSLEDRQRFFAPKANGPAGAPTPPSHGSTIPNQESSMNVETNTTAEADPAMSKRSLRYHVETSLEEAKTTMHLAEAATLLFRHLVKDTAEPGKSPRISHGHVEMFHTLIDLSWSRASSTFDELERFQEAIR